jgi:hypothetical protein
VGITPVGTPVTMAAPPSTIAGCTDRPTSPQAPGPSPLVAEAAAIRIYRHPTESKVALAWEDADLPKLEAALGHPDTPKAKAKHTVREPMDVYVEVEGGR